MHASTRILLLSLTLLFIGDSVSAQGLLKSVKSVETKPNQILKKESKKTNENCGRKSDVYRQFFSLQQSFVPQDEGMDATTVLKKIKMRFVIVEKDNEGNYSAPNI